MEGSVQTAQQRRVRAAATVSPGTSPLRRPSFGSTRKQRLEYHRERMARRRAAQIARRPGFTPTHGPAYRGYR